MSYLKYEKVNSQDIHILTQEKDHINAMSVIMLVQHPGIAFLKAERSKLYQYSECDKCNSGIGITMLFSEKQIGVNSQGINQITKVYKKEQKFNKLRQPYSIKPLKS